MKPAKYVILNPTGNLTALVTEWGGAEDEPEITRRLMRVSEQVAYLEPPQQAGALARIRMMGGEFCGNAAMASAGWLVRDRIQPGTEMTVPIEMSGAGSIVFCRIRGMEENSFEGTVDMPRVLEIYNTEVRGVPLTAVRTEGILHLIREGWEPLAEETAEELLKAAAETVTDDAVGLLDRNPETGSMIPLVFVRASGTTVRETACGSGSAAIAAAEAVRRGNGRVLIPVVQPGGTIRAEAAAENGTVTETAITGTVFLGEDAGEITLKP